MTTTTATNGMQSLAQLMASHDQIGQQIGASEPTLTMRQAEFLSQQFRLEAEEQRRVADRLKADRKDLLQVQATTEARIAALKQEIQHIGHGQRLYVRNQAEAQAAIAVVGCRFWSADAAVRQFLEDAHLDVSDSPN